MKKNLKIFALLFANFLLATSCQKDKIAPMVVPNNDIETPISNPINISGIYFSDWITPTWSIKNDSIFCQIRLMPINIFDKENDPLKVYYREVNGNGQNLDLGRTLILKLPAEKPFNGKLGVINQKYTIQLIPINNYYYLKLSANLDTKSIQYFNDLGVQIFWQYVPNKEQPIPRLAINF